MRGKRSAYPDERGRFRASAFAPAPAVCCGLRVMPPARTSMT